MRQDDAIIRRLQTAKPFALRILYHIIRSKKSFEMAAQILRYSKTVNIY
ncbi:hypothetical protein ANACOL_00795 [Anaerotruncus colihominis DSM 17241]|uniref:Uncharacterized protein n=1 Tax=Anaerotruncus colihominis DSM 17241 TaxID=445972 RepID=B0P7Q6_9FIRM|nr:hypothetical protein ANACOL_00795 [Anaerotruncus colihominis DSM 17241]